MSVLIRGMKMPESCHECVAGFGGGCFVCPPWEDGYCPDEGRASWCPLIELPPHGRLIDADTLNEMINQSYPMTDRVDIHNGYAIVQEIMKQLPTIIEAENPTQRNNSNALDALEGKDADT